MADIGIFDGGLMSEHGRKIHIMVYEMNKSTKTKLEIYNETGVAKEEIKHLIIKLLDRKLINQGHLLEKIVNILWNYDPQERMRRFRKYVDVTPKGIVIKNPTGGK